MPMIREITLKIIFELALLISDSCGVVPTKGAPRQSQLQQSTSIKFNWLSTVTAKKVLDKLGLLPGISKNCSSQVSITTVGISYISSL